MESFDLIDPPRVAFERALARMHELSAPRGDGEPSPFFLFLHTFDVHSPYAPSREYASLFTDPDYTGGVISSREALAERAGDDWETRHTVFFDAVDRNDPKDVARLIDLYDASIRETDSLLGEMLARARVEGLLDDTIVVVLSDHGEEFMEHGRLLHSQLYRELLHVPLVVALPGEAGARLAGKRIEPLVRLVDVAPTLLEWLGVPVPPHMQGTSLAPLLRGAPPPEPLLASSHHRQGMQSLQLGVWKLIEHLDRGGRTVRELYDVSRDSAEHHDRSAAKGAVADLLAHRLAALETESRALHAERTRGRRVRPDAETRARLRALGYLGGRADGPADRAAGARRQGGESAGELDPD